LYSSLLRCEPDFEIAGEASDGASAISIVEEIQPGIVLMDISMPGIDGIQATRIIHKKLPNISIIGLSMFETGEQEKNMREAGAVCFLTKNGPSDKADVSVLPGAYRTGAQASFRAGAAGP
jgi:DNA-binding NarL/FixJ family response regulator